MKRTIALTVLLSILLTFSACINQNVPPTNTSEEETAGAAGTTSSVTETSAPMLDLPQLPMHSIALTVVKDTTYAENHDEIFNLVYQNIALVTPEPEIADKIIIDYLNRIDAITAESNTLESGALSAYSAGEYWTPYLCQYTFEPTRIDSGILSLLGTYATFNGSAHPDISNTTVTYSMVTGQVLKLSDILVPNASADQLCDLVIKALEPQRDVLYEGYEDTVRSRFAIDFMQDEGWYLSDNGLCYYFSPREIAGYVSGVIVAEVPYSDLVGIMDDSRFPAEQDVCTGSITGIPFDNADLAKFNQFTEITLTEDSQKILLYTNGSVRNIRVESGYWNADGSVYTPEFTLLALSTLTPGDAIMIESDIPDTLPTLRLSYLSDGELVTTYITQAFLDNK